MRLMVLWLLCEMLGAQTVQVTPQSIRQGETLQIRGPAELQSARLQNRTIRLFPQEEGGVLGLMPVKALTSPGAYNLELLDRTGTVVQTQAITVLDAHYPRQNIVIPPAIAALQPSAEEDEKVGAFLKEVLPERYWREPLQLPVSACLTSRFGVARMHNGRLTGDYHKGIDQGAVFGTPIRSITAGVVKIAQQFPEGGGTVAVDHGQGLQSIYLHMSRFAAHEGDTVKAGDVLGFVGTTGRSTGPHLHWGLYANGVPVSPGQWMRLPACGAGSPAKRRSPTKK